MKTTLKLSIFALVAGLFTSLQPVLAQNADPVKTPFDDLAQEIEDRMEELSAEILSLEGIPFEIPETESLLADLTIEMCGLRGMIDETSIPGYLENMNGCISTLIQNSMDKFGGEEFITAQADEILEKTLSARAEMYRRISETYGADGPFQQQLRRLKSEIEALDMEIENLLNRELDATEQLEAQQNKRIIFEQLLIKLDVSLNLTLSMANRVTDYVQSLPRDSSEILSELERIGEKARNVIDWVEEISRNVTSDDQPGGQEEDN